MRKYALMLVCVFYAAACIADEAEDKKTKDLEDFAMKWAEEFAKCAGAFDTAAALGSTEEEFSTNYVHEMANGALVAAKYMAGLAGYKDGYVQGIYESRLNYWKLYTKDNLDDLTTEIKHCASEEVNSLQGEIVKTVRKEMYKVKE